MIKQADEFGISAGGQKVAALQTFITDTHSLGLEKAKGLLLTSAFYWDLDEATRAWSRRFAERNKGRMPTMVQARRLLVPLRTTSNPSPRPELMMA